MPCCLPAGRMSMRRKNGRAAFSRFLFVLYCLAMLWLLFGQRLGQMNTVVQQKMNINLTPFQTIRHYLYLLTTREYALHAIVNLFGNILLFVPPGYMLPKIWKKCRKFLWTMVIMLFVILLVEILQYKTSLGSMDVDDLLLNMFGVLIGYTYWKMMLGKNVKKQ